MPTWINWLAPVGFLCLALAVLSILSGSLRSWRPKPSRKRGSSHHTVGEVVAEALWIVALLLMVLALGMKLAEPQEKEQYSVRVYESSCFDIESTAKTRMEFPLVNGDIDRKRGVILGVVAHIHKECLGHDEVRR